MDPVSQLTVMATTVLDNQAAFINKFMPGYITTPIDVIGYEANQFGDMVMKVVGTVRPSKRWYFEDEERLAFFYKVSKVQAWAKNAELYTFLAGEVLVK